MTKKRCTKKRYATVEEARQAIQEMAKRYPSIVFKNVHRCAICRAYHVTSTPPRRGRRIQR